MGRGGDSGLVGGRALIDAVARELKLGLSMDKSYHGLMARTTVKGQTVWLLEPQTFMNRCGKSVAALARFFKITPQEILVAHDELDLAPGQLKLKQGGGHAGHNGLRDILSALGTPDFWRLRLGIGHPRDLAAEGARVMDVADYVLRRPLQAEQKQIDASIENGLQILPLFLKGDTQAAMLELHSKTN